MPSVTPFSPSSARTRSPRSEVPRASIKKPTMPSKGDPRRTVGLVSVSVTTGPTTTPRGHGGDSKATRTTHTNSTRS